MDWQSDPRPAVEGQRLTAAYKITSREEALAVVAEMERRKSQPRLQLVDDDFDKQATFVRDESPLQAALCTRRAGKSYGLGLKMFREAKKCPGCSVLYIALTRDAAKRIMWKDVVKDINRKHGLQAKFNESELLITLPNGPDQTKPYDGGSEIKLVGMDASKDEMEKVLGGKYRLVVIDEAGSFKIDLTTLVYEHLEPAVADWNGMIVLAGTPTAMTFGLFYNVTKSEEHALDDDDPIEEGWSVHYWNTFDNPHMAEKWGEQEARIVERDPNVIHLPRYKRMRKGEWVKDLDDLCYKYEKSRNFVSDLPDSAWINVLGVDLGFNDDSAFVVQSFRDHDVNLYTRHAYKRPGMTISDVAERIQYYIDTYSPMAIVIDNASKQAVEELKQRFDLPLEAAEKHGKAEFIEIMNSEYLLGRIKLTPGSEENLGKEYNKLIWDPEEKKKKKWVEHPAAPNHCADAALYSWRKCLQYRAMPEIDPPTEVEKLDQWEEREAMKIDRSNLPFWEQEEDDAVERILDVG